MSTRIAPDAAQTDRHAFDAARQEMLRAMVACLAAGMSAGEAQAEVDATIRALRQIVGLGAR